MQAINATAISPADSSMWIATSERGLVRVGKNGKAFAYSAEKGDFPNNNIVSLSFDEEGILWMADADSSVFSYSSFSGFVKQDVVPGDIASALYRQEITEQAAPAQQPEVQQRPWFGSWWFLLLTVLLFTYCIYSLFHSRKKCSSHTSQPEPAAPLPSPDPALVTAPVSAPVSAPVAAPVTSPVSAPVSAPITAPITAPKNAPQPKLKPATPKATPSRPEPRPVQDHSEGFYEKVVEIVRGNYTNPDFGVENIAEILGMSRVHLNRKLKAEGEASPSELIKSARMEYAANLLKEGKKNIAEIAAASGFASASYFSSAFKDWYGTAPADFAKNNS